MGALHDGHIRLVQEAAACGREILVSIFVNPAQFNNAQDLIRYPRTVAADLKKLEAAGATAVFIPSAEDLYPKHLEPVSLDLGALENRYEGHYRPGHFQGVVKVLHRLFGLIRPDHVFFGLKDLQQCLVVEKLIATFFPFIRQHNIPTMRESSGLAMSSRNTRLSAEGLKKAAAIYAGLTLMGSGAAASRNQAIELLEKADITTEYLDLVDLPDMGQASALKPGQRQAVVFAGYLEGVRLIDNITLGPGN